MPLAEGVARRAEDRERRHVGAEQRQHEHERAERAAGEEEVLGAGASVGAAEREDADVDDRDQVEPDDASGITGRGSSRCDGQYRRTSSAITDRTARV